ncbi:hypothetical protein [Streptomyces antarcticus]|uniref:hypothetical protein n=1 Tax=Streptomyces antarcticus TaxID=2996458 RepID=UPI00226FE948|nr:MULTISPECIES: hypothetical protein [unclassified Streptomyces]MCY0943037.1 hypothetical protein [Streptomyces sp. H34-AA3]MCZ4087528.1 hypothetical protein [Streptomyces sp. H34-S5]
MTVRHKTALLAVSALVLAAAAVGFRSQAGVAPGGGDGAARSGPAPGNQQPYGSQDSGPDPHPYPYRGERWTRAVADLLGP